MTSSRTALLLALPLFSAAAATISPLGARGYAVLPEPQRVTLGSSDFRFGTGWSVQRQGVSADDIAVASLTQGLRSRFHATPSTGSVKLVMAPGSVTIGDALRTDKKA